MKRQIRVTDQLPYEHAEQWLLTLMDESPRGEEMRRLYDYLKSCEDVLKDCEEMMRDLADAAH